MGGYIFDYRQELESDIWLLPPMYHRVWQYLKYKANHADGRIPNTDGTVTIIRAGQHATSYRHIAKGVGYFEGTKWREPNPKTVKKILEWLVLQEMIAIQGNTLGTVVTIVNWDLYQKELIQGNTKVTLGKHLLDTNKKNKEEIRRIKDINKKAIDEFFEKLWLAYPNKKGKASVSDTKKKELFEVGDKIFDCIDKYVKYVTSENWIKYKNGSTFFNTGYVDYLEENYVELKPTTTNKFHNHEQRDYDFDDLEAKNEAQLEAKLKEID